MKLLKPDWIHHDEKPIFSIDVHPDGTKFATGGQGNDSGRVVIWNLAPVLSTEAELDKSVPKILCQLDNHLACVNCVRWSMNGMLLASGGDDKVIMIWKKGKGPSAVFGNSGITKTTESWRCISNLRGHSGDILDIAWSPQDRWLASCSVDNNIHIWDMHNLPAVVAILKGHTGLVKGVAWDPVGKFIASQSDDRSVKIWKTSDWTCQSTITEPFEECGGTTHILRLSWSPDGLYLVSAHAMNGGGPTAQIIEREGWKCDKDFVGHRKAVTCVRFHNSILKRQAPKTNKYCCLAVGSRDRSLSVWMTALQRPLVVIHELFQDSILDLSWSTDKNILLACSTDGTIACLQFTAAELGTPLSEEDKNILYQRMYGKSANIDMAQPEKDMIIEYAELVNVNNTNDQSNHTMEISLQNNNLEIITKSPSNSMTIDSSISPTSSANKIAIHKQIETRTADGKRRITPMFIPIDHENTDERPELSSSSRSTSNIVVEKATAINNIANSVDQIPTTNNIPKIDIETAKINDKHLDNRLTKQAPIKSQTVTKSTTQSSTTQSTSAAPSTFSSKLNILTSGKIVPFNGMIARTMADIRIEITNALTNTIYGQLCKVTAFTMTTMKKQIWEVYVGSPVVNFSLCSKFLMACSIDGTIRFFNIRTGIFVLPIMKLPTAAIQCAFSLNSLLGGVISQCGQVRIWNIAEQTIFMKSSCTDILLGTTVTHFHITENGIAFILLSNGCSFSYSKQLETWLVLNSSDPVIRHGMSTTPVNLPKNIRNYPLTSVQATAHNFQPVARTFADISASDWKHTAKLSFIENQIKICEAINSPFELKHWYSILGSHLASHGTEKRIRILLDDLLGSNSASSLYVNANINRSILGITKEELLRKVLDHLKKESRWQRIYMEYSEQLQEMKNIIKINGTNDVDMKDDTKLT